MERKNPFLALFTRLEASFSTLRTCLTFYLPTPKVAPYRARGQHRCKERLNGGQDSGDLGNNRGYLALHQETMDSAWTARDGNGNALGPKPLAIALAIVAQGVIFGGDDKGWRQTG